MELECEQANLLLGLIEEHVLMAASRCSSRAVKSCTPNMTGAA